MKDTHVRITEEHHEKATTKYPFHGGLSFAIREALDKYFAEEEGGCCGKHKEDKND